MAVVLATWNPERYPELDAEWLADGETIRVAGSLSDRWSMGSRKGGVVEGDEILLVRQNRDRGIVRSGKAISPVFQDLHWEEYRAERGEVANFVLVEWLHQVAEPVNRLPTEILNTEVPEVTWNSLMGSGVIVDDAKAAQTLLDLWFDHLGLKQTDPQRNPPWTWDEELLAFDTYLEIGQITASSAHPKVQELSALLRALTIHPQTDRTPTFRNPDGVSRKLGDIHSHKPGYSGKPTSGSRLDNEIWERFGSDLDTARHLARTLRIEAPSSITPEPDELEFESTHKEGRLTYRLHRRRERDPKLRKNKIQSALKSQGLLRCEACGSDLQFRYGELGSMIFECHHLIPLSETGETVTRMDDVALLCPNCHRIAHRIKPWPSLAELRLHCHSDSDDNQGD